MRYLIIAAVVMFCAGQTPAQQKWGTIKGQVVFDAKERPALKKIDVNKDQAHCLSKGTLFDETWTVNKKTMGVKWAFIWLKPDPNGNGKLPIHPALAKAALKDAVMDQPCCQFVPHCLVMRAGQDLIVKNSAPVAHNSNLGDFGNPLIAPKGEFKVKAMPAYKLPYTVSCNIHPWMNARILVVDHPYVTVTDKDGKFEIKNAPAGKFRLAVWHEDIGWLGGAAGANGQKIEIKAEGVTDVGKLKIKPDPKEKTGGS